MFIAETARDCAFAGEAEAAQRLSSLAFDLDACSPQELAVIALLGQDKTLYRRVCAAMLQSVRAGTPRAPSVFDVVWLLGLGPDGVADYRDLLKLADTELAALATSSAPDQQKRERQHLMIRSRAAILIRSGRPDLCRPNSTGPAPSMRLIRTRICCALRALASGKGRGGEGPQSWNAGGNRRLLPVRAIVVRAVDACRASERSRVALHGRRSTSPAVRRAVT